MKLTAELERTTDLRLKAEGEVLSLNEKLSHVAQQKACLMRTTEMYEADKRELELEVGVNNLLSLLIFTLCLQLSAKHDAIVRRDKETDTIRSTMQGFVSAEKEKFERLASKMKTREKDLAIKSEKLRQVEELIKNSPCPGVKPRNPLRDKNGSFSCEETVGVV